MESNIIPFPMPEGVDVMTIAQGAEDLGIASDIAERMADADKQWAARRFLWLLGDLALGADADAVRDAATVDATGDPSLLCWLHSPTAREFVGRFAEDDWSIYELTEVLGDDDWAHTVIKRARGLIGVGAEGLAQWRPIALHHP